MEEENGFAVRLHLAEHKWVTLCECYRVGPTAVSFAGRELRAVSKTDSSLGAADADPWCIKMMTRGVGGVGRFRDCGRQLRSQLGRNRSPYMTSTECEIPGFPARVGVAVRGRDHGRVRSFVGATEERLIIDDHSQKSGGFLGVPRNV